MQLKKRNLMNARWAKAQVTAKLRKQRIHQSAKRSYITTLVHGFLYSPGVGILLPTRGALCLRLVWEGPLTQCCGRCSNQGKGQNMEQNRWLDGPVRQGINHHYQETQDRVWESENREERVLREWKMSLNRPNAWTDLVPGAALQQRLMAQHLSRPFKGQEGSKYKQPCNSYIWAISLITGQLSCSISASSVTSKISVKRLSIWRK